MFLLSLLGRDGYLRGVDADNISVLKLGYNCICGS
jgi:hypothetical protein